MNRLDAIAAVIVQSTSDWHFADLDPYIRSTLTRDEWLEVRRRIRDLDGDTAAVMVESWYVETATAWLKGRDGDNAETRRFFDGACLDVLRSSVSGLSTTWLRREFGRAMYDRSTALGVIPYLLSAGLAWQGTGTVCALPAVLATNRRFHSSLSDQEVSVP